MPLITSTGKPRVILGLMTFGEGAEAAAAGARITSLDEYNEALDHLQAAGYNEVDTARGYIGGKQEGFTQKAHWKERGLTLAVRISLCCKKKCNALSFSYSFPHHCENYLRTLNYPVFYE